MSTLAITTLVLLALAAVVAGAAAWLTRRRWLAARQQAHLLAREQRAAEQALDRLVHEVLPQIHRAGGRVAPPVLALELAGTAVGGRLELVVKATVGLAQAMVRDIQYAAHQEIEQAKRRGAEELRRVHTDAQAEIARVQANAVRSTEAAVRSVSSALVGMAARTSRRVSEGVREHQDDAAFETLAGIDRTVQQTLLVAQGWTVLAGGKLTRHWTTTTLTDVVRAAMGYVEDYQRVAPQELPLAVKTRVVGPVVHTLTLLLDNALRFSPPQSRVHVSFEQGHHGVTVIVDDSGLQMTPEQLDEARDVLTGQRTDDITQLGALPKTGFRVAAVLARAYGFRVDVQAPNALLGTRALLTLPQDLLTTAAEAAPPPAPAQAQAQAAHSVPQGALAPVPESRLALAPPAPGPEPFPAHPPAEERLAALGATGTTASGLTRRHRRGTPAPAPARRPVNAEPGRASVIAAWARGTHAARAERDAAPSPTPDEQGHEA
ncbi:sensor histidine kinase [Streptomyces marianii]|uniref:histidine kinase n=1 Tax=Streptomyces marianii TaxID=1817406 RepID=A0A5R9DYT2_9ACTN|nr:ATP-binding protein [Streptomyces marianii]TLQ42546.1 sensor histidine kinase [Streptomyces marianii]